MNDIHSQIVRDLITRTEVAVNDVMSVAHQTGIVFKEDDVVDSVERSLPEGYPTPADGPEPRRQIIRNIVRDVISGEMYEDETSERQVHVDHDPDGWTFPIEPGVKQACTVNHLPGEERQECPAPAVYKITERNAGTFTFSVWCDEHLLTNPDIEGANLTPELENTRTYFRRDGWVLPDYSDFAECGVNIRQPNGPRCEGTAVWQVVEDHAMHQTITWWCGKHLSQQPKFA